MTAPSVAVALERVHRGVRRFGVAGSVKRVASLACGSLAKSLYSRERHVWYALDLTRERARIALPVGFALNRAGRSELALLEELPTIGRVEAGQRLAFGAELWLVRDGVNPAFSCWIFRERTPVLAAKTGWLALPPRTVCLEDSVTSPRYRGRGLAPAAWSQIADCLQGENVTSIITKVAEDNAPSRRAVEKAGFQSAALMSLNRVALRSHVELQPCGTGDVSTYLETNLAAKRLPADPRTSASSQGASPTTILP